VKCYADKDENKVEQICHFAYKLRHTESQWGKTKLLAITAIIKCFSGCAWCRYMRMCVSRQLRHVLTIQWR